MTAAAGKSAERSTGKSMGQSLGPRRGQGSDARPAAVWLGAAALVVALAVVVGRATVQETVRDAFRAPPGAEAIPLNEPGPAGSLVLDLISFLPALLLLLRRAIGGPRLVAGWPHLLLGAFALLAVASVYWADDKFAALVASLNLAGAAALFFAGSQIVRDGRRLRQVAGVMLGLLMICCAEAAEFRWVELPDLITDFQKNRQTIFEQRGWEPGSFTAQQFEKKVMSGEPMGFYFSANSFAAVLVLLGVVSAGLAIQRRADGDEWGWSAVVLVVLAAAVWVDWLTGCRAALATPVVAAALMLLWRYDGAWLGRHRRGAFSSGVAAVLAGVAAVVIAGLVHGGLWQTSLTFRWRYWIGSARLWREHPWLGVGWGNFGAHYLAVRIQSAAEEIQDPHNFAVRATTELGIVGLLLILAWLMSGAWSATQVGELPITPPRSEPDEDQAARQLAKAIVWPLSLAILINIGASIDFTQSGSYVFYELLKRGLFFGLLVLGALIGMARGTAAAAMDDRAAPWIRGALLAALATFVLHNTIEFSIFETGPMCLFFFLAGAAIGVGAPPDQDNDEPDRSRAIAAFVMGICGWCAAAFVTIKMLDAESWAQSADEAYRTSRFAEADRDLANAIYASPVANSDYAYRRAEVAIAGRQSPGEIRAGLQAALFIDPTNVKAARTLGQFEIRQANPDAVAFSAAYERVLALDPCDVQARVEYADGLMRLGEADKAAAEYRDALRLNDLYDITEPKRLSAEEVTRIEKILQVLR